MKDCKSWGQTILKSYHIWPERYQRVYINVAWYRGPVFFAHLQLINIVSKTLLWCLVSRKTHKVQSTIETNILDCILCKKNFLDTFIDINLREEVWEWILKPIKTSYTCGQFSPCHMAQSKVMDKETEL